MMKLSCVLLLVGSVSALEAPKRHKHHLMQHLHHHHAVQQHHDHHDHHGQVKHEEHKPRHHLVHHQHKKPVHTHPRIQKAEHDLHQKEAPVQFPPKIGSSSAQTAAPIHHQFLASAVDRKVGLKCYESETSARGELNTCDGGDDAACFIRYKEDAGTGSRSYYRRYCTVKDACAAKDGAAYIDQAGFQSYSDGGSNVFYRCCSFKGCNSGAAAEIPGTDVGALFFLANAESGDLLQLQDGALSACSGDQCPGKESIMFNLKETGNGFSLTAPDGTLADVNTAEWIVEEIGTGVFSIANGGGEAVGGFSAVKLLPATEWPTVLTGRQCQNQKQAGYKTLSDCTAACDADSECIGAVSFPKIPRYGEGEDLCESLLSCQCFLVTGACDEETSVENADFSVHAHRCSGVVCTALDQCHTVGVCSREDGKCSNPEMPATTLCDDNDETTGNDQCQAGGICKGEDLCKDVDCSAQDQCYNDGVCDYQTGKCSVPAKEQGAQCDDNLENTVNDVCDGKGGCAGTDYCSGVDCSAQSECFEDGECDPYSGACSTPPKPKGTECDDGNEVLVNDQCDGSGVCAGEDLCAGVVCEAKDAECHEVGACQPADGTCTDPLSAEGTACDDNNGDTVKDQCDASGTCAGEDLCAGKSCPAASECFEEGICQHADGSCKVEQKAEGTDCDDGNSLTDDDKCTADGVCAGKGRCEDVTCEAIDQCHDEGECDPENGQCSAPLKSEGSRCDDGSDFTVDDRCQADGICVGENKCADVACDSPDVCESAGTCDQNTGQCNYPTAADGVSCDDGDDDTVNDMCSSGSCAGENLCADVTCEAASQCHEAGNCDQHTGTCDSPQKQAGTSCDDGSSVTKNDQCTDEGECVGEELCADVTCEAVDDCHDAGVCNSNTGVCSNPQKAEGSKCDDGNDDTKHDQCTAAGQCQGQNLCEAVVCIATNLCHEAGECDKETGSCSVVKKKDGTECDDNNEFTTDDKCDAGECGGTSSTGNGPASWGLTTF